MGKEVIKPSKGEISGKKSGEWMLSRTDKRESHQLMMIPTD